MLATATRTSTRSMAAPKAANRNGSVTTTATRKLRVLLADDHPVVRRGVSMALSSFPGIEIVGEAGDGQEAIRKARELTPDVLLMDVAMPVMSGLMATEELKKELPQVKVLIFSTHTTPDHVLRIFRSGASGYVLKESPTEEIVDALQKVGSGEVFFSPKVAHVALNQFMCKDPTEPDLMKLSNREREVLIHLADGLSNKEVACRLDIGTRTVETHRERLMHKLNIRSVAGLTKFAIVKGLIPFPTMAI